MKAIIARRGPVVATCDANFVVGAAFSEPHRAIAWQGQLLWLSKRTWCWTARAWLSSMKAALISRKPQTGVYACVGFHQQGPYDQTSARSLLLTHSRSIIRLTTSRWKPLCAWQ